MTTDARDGVLVVDKPIGLTSFDVVRRVRRASGVRRVGHGGTLDPLASGVLPICLGEATKLAQFLLDADKEYQVTACFGVQTDTLDADGQVTARADAGRLSARDVEAALPALTGAIQQVPPAYSALKRQGRPLYDYARAGEVVEVAPRAVTVHELSLTDWAGPQAVTLRVRCSKGTYVRSLVADLGRALGPGAHVTALRRLRSGPFGLGQACGLDQALGALADGAALPLVSLEEALAHLPRCSADGQTVRALTEGKRIPWQALAGAPCQALPGAVPGAVRVRVLSEAGGLVAVAERSADDCVRTLRVFNADEHRRPPSAEPRSPAIAPPVSLERPSAETAARRLVSD